MIIVSEQLSDKTRVETLKGMYCDMRYICHCIYGSVE